MDNTFANASDKLFTAAQETFETLTFTAVENGASYKENFTLPGIGDLYWGKIDILLSSKEKYKMELSISIAYLNELLQTINPVDEAHTDEALHDMMGELINTLAGSFMLKMEPETGPFSLGLPMSIEHKLPHEGEILKLMVIVDDNHPVVMALYTNN